MYGFFYSWPFETWAYEETDDITLKVRSLVVVVAIIANTSFCNRCSFCCSRSYLR